MGCYCRTIPKCRRDIRRLERALTYFRKISDCNDWNITSHFRNLELNHTLCITPDNIVTLSDTMIHKNDQWKESVAELIHQCERELNSLENTLSDMEESDDRYHESDDD